MRRTRVGLLSATVLASTVLVGVPTAPASAASGWSAIELRPLVTGDTTYPLAMNDAGTTVGFSGTSGVRWDANGNPTALAAPEGCTQPEATAIDDAGVAVGYAQCPDLPLMGVEWAPDGTVTELESPLATNDLSNGGVLVGQRHPGSVVKETPFAYLPGHGRIDLETAGGYGSAAATTDWGYVVGEVELQGLPSPSAVGWYGPYVFPLTDSAVPSRAIDVNESGVALVELLGAGSRYVLVYPGGGTRDATGSPSTDRVVALNDSGIEVGWRGTGVQPKVPGYFVADQLVPFSTVAPDSGLDWSKQEPVAVNDSGWVAGEGPAGSGNASKAWLLRPAP